MAVSSVEPYRAGNAIVIPKRAEGPNVIGIGWVPILPDDPEFQQWDAYLRARERWDTPVARRPSGRRPGGR